MGASTHEVSRDGPLAHVNLQRIGFDHHCGASPHGALTDPGGSPVARSGCW